MRRLFSKRLSPFKKTFPIKFKPVLNADKVPAFNALDPAEKTRIQTPLTQSAACKHLTDEDIQTYERDGVICLRNVLSADEIEALRDAVTRQINACPPSKTSIDLEHIRRHVWASPIDIQHEDKNLGMGWPSTPIEKTPIEKTDSLSFEIEEAPSLELEEAQARFTSTPLPHSTSAHVLVHSVENILRMILNTDPDAVPNIETSAFESLGDDNVANQDSGIEDLAAEETRDRTLGAETFEAERLEAEKPANEGLYIKPPDIEPSGIKPSDIESSGNSITQDDRSGRFYIENRTWPRFPKTKSVACDSVLPEICATLMASETLSFWGDTTQIKTPKTRQRTTIHQDWAYIPVTGIQSCSVWIALDATTVKNSGKHYIRGSHKWGKVFAANIIITQTANPLSLYESMPDIENNLADYDIIRFDVNPGDIIIHNILTLHGSTGNISSDQSQRAISLRYCGDDILYFDKPGALETNFLTQSHKKGDKLHPKHFPTVWPKPIATPP